MRRRRLRKDLGTIVVLLVGGAAVLAACTKGEHVPPEGEVEGGIAVDAGVGQKPGEPAARALTFTSSESMGHVHRVSLRPSAFERPVGGLERQTTLADGHVHFVDFSEAELRRVADGGVVEKRTTYNDGHLHVFTLRLPR